MRTRTLLTTPPGQEPTVEAASPRSDPERYSPALDLPREPSVPGRHRRGLIAAAILVVLAVTGVVAYRLVTVGQFQDPAVPGVPGQGVALLADEDPRSPR